MIQAQNNEFQFEVASAFAKDCIFPDGGPCSRRRLGMGVTSVRRVEFLVGKDCRNSLLAILWGL